MTLRRMEPIKGITVQATDGPIGNFVDFIFEDRTWIVRYLVVEAWPLLPGRRSLIATSALQEPDWANRLFPVDLEKEKMKQAPPMDLDAPLTRDAEASLHATFSWLPYWGPAGATLGAPVSGPPASGDRERRGVSGEMRERRRKGECHVHRLGKTHGFQVTARGEELGFVTDHVVDDASWRVRYLVVDTRRWLPGKKVLLVPSWIDNLSWPLPLRPSSRSWTSAARKA